MAVGFRSASTITKTTGSLATPATPSGVVAGDLLIAVQGCEPASSLADMTASGWTERFTQDSTASLGAIKVWSRTATGSDTYDFAHNSTRDCSVAVLCLTDAGDNDLIVATSSNTSSSTSHVAPSVAGIVDGLLVCTYMAYPATGIAPTWTAPSGMTERTDSNASSSRMAMSSHTLATTSTSATGTKTATCSRSYPHTGISFVVGPPLAAGDTGSLLSFF